MQASSPLEAQPMTFLSLLLSLKRGSARNRDGGDRRPRRATRRRGFVPRLDVLEDRTLLSTFTVTNLDNSGAGSLRQAVLDANATPGSDVIDFAPGLQGTIVLTTGPLGITDHLQIHGPGAAQLAVSGNDASRVFEIAGGVSVGIAGLTITRGHGFGVAGAILNAGGDLTLLSDVLLNNRVTGVPGVPGANVTGGAIVNLPGSMLVISHSRFLGNQAIASDGGTGGLNAALGIATAGAISNLADASVDISDTTFSDNQAIGGSGASGGSGFYNLGNGAGGALLNHGNAFVSQSEFSHNRAIGGNNNTGGAGGVGRIGGGTGGAIQEEELGATLFVTDSTFTDNQSIGGNDNTGGASGFNVVGNGVGGAITAFTPSGLTTILNCTFDFNLARGGDGNRGAGAAGFISAGAAGALLNDGVTAIVSDSRFIRNLGISGTGAEGANGGDTGGGGIGNYNDFMGQTNLTLINSVLEGNVAIGGPGGAGGNGGKGFGGGLFNDATSVATIFHTRITDNVALGGPAGAGGSAGPGLGGGIFVFPGGQVCVDASTRIDHNHASTAGDDVFGPVSLCNDPPGPAFSRRTFDGLSAVGGAGGNGGLLNGPTSGADPSGGTAPGNDATGGQDGWVKSLVLSQGNPLASASSRDDDLSGFLWLS
jgi:hypothetical protein